MKIFIIDDDLLSTFVTQNMLELENITQDIHAFHSASEALEAIHQSSGESLPDVILLDLNMPLLDGWEFLKALSTEGQRLGSKCGVYILTSSVDTSDRVRMKEYPKVLDMFHKPISSEDIRLIFSNYLSPSQDTN